MQVEDRSGQATPQQLEAATQALIAEASKDPRIAAAFSSFRASVPQLYANVDRVKAKKEERRRHRYFPSAAGLSRQLLHQRFQLSGPDVPGDRAGRCAVPRAGVGCRAAQNAQRRRADGAAGHGDGFERYCRCRSHQSLQPLSVGRNQRRRRAGRQQRAGHRDHGEPREERCCPRDSATNGPNWPIRKKRQGTRRCIFSRSACCSCSSRTRPNTKALRCRCRSS